MSTMRRLIALSILLAAALPLPMGAAGGADGEAPAPPWYGGYSFHLAAEDGQTVATKIGGVASLPRQIGNGLALLIVEITRDDDGPTADFYYLDPDNRTMVGRERTSVHEDRVERSYYRYDPPVDLYGFPLYPGKAWSVNSTEYVNYSITYNAAPYKPIQGEGDSRRIMKEFRVGNWTTVDTDFGNFSALPVEETPLDAISYGQNKRIVRYYAPEARHYVRMEDHRDSVGLWRTFNLTKLDNNVLPTPVAHVNSHKTYKGENLSFDATHSYDVDDGIASLGWSLGDGNASSLANFTHAYERPGVYNATLTVTDGRGAETRSTLAIHVRSRPPIPLIDAPRRVMVGEAFNVSGADSQDPDGHVVQFRWRFTADATATGVNATHAFHTPGRHIIHLTLTDDDGVTVTQRVSVQVVDGAEGSTGTNGSQEPGGGDEPIRSTILNPRAHAAVDGPTDVRWRVTGPATALAFAVDGKVIWHDKPGVDGFTWNASAHDAGEHTITLYVYNSHGGVTRTTIPVEVTEPDTPPAPNTRDNSTDDNLTDAETTRGHTNAREGRTLPVPVTSWAHLAALAVACLTRATKRRKV